MTIISLQVCGQARQSLSGIADPASFRLHRNSTHIADADYGCKEPGLTPTNSQLQFMNSLTKLQSIIAWVCRITAAVILLQTLFFKFSAAPESVYIFTKVGLEPWGRIGSGVAELIAAILILVPRTTWLGAGLALGVMAGAILSHLTVLGIVVMDDGGLLFGLALAVAACSVALLFLQRRRLPVIGAYL